MKFTPEVVAALETLKNAAENDFERHRLDVLEKDLTAPPKVEVIDETHQKFLGFNFRLTKGGHYFYNMGLQQAVWLYHHGEIPPKHEIHHIDEDKANNDITNLQLLTGSEHRKLHNLLGVPVAKLKKREFVCQNCGKKFLAFDVGTNLFCSPRCNYQYHKVTRKCVECGKEFLTNKYGKARFCSVKCKHVARSRECSEVRVCPACNKEFVTPLCKDLSSFFEDTGKEPQKTALGSATLLFADCLPQWNGSPRVLTICYRESLSCHMEWSQMTEPTFAPKFLSGILKFLT